jgi:hypothetical protein
VTLRPVVFDHTALIALFDAHPVLLGLWQQADRGERTLVMPAAAVAEANHVLGASHNAWSALLYPVDVTVTPLDSSQAIDTGHMPGALAVRHVIHEVRAVSGIIVTRAPWQYPPDAGPTRPV